jgi:hypothetical protein
LTVRWRVDIFAEDIHEEGRMARIRSPNYPAISLADAINRVGQVHAKEHQHPATKEVVLKGMGYSGVHGTSLGALSAALKYGLLEQDGKGEDYRVSDRAMAILHPHTPEEKAQAVRDAARSPALFSELLDYFKGDLPSDDNLRAYLVRRGFSQTSLPGVIQAFRDTMELVSPASSDYDQPSSERTVGAKVDVPAAATAAAAFQVRGHPPTFEAPEPYRLTVTPAGIDVAGRLVDEATVDSLIRHLNALKLLLRPVASIRKPTGQDEAAN